MVKIIFFFLVILIPFISSKPIVSAVKKSSPKFLCFQNTFFGFSLNITFSEPLTNNYYFKIINDNSPISKYKCSINVENKKFTCFSPISDPTKFNSVDTYNSQLPYYFPYFNDFQWNSESFIIAFKSKSFTNFNLSCNNTVPKNAYFSSIDYSFWNGYSYLDVVKESGNCTSLFIKKKMRTFYSYNITMNLFFGDLKTIIEREENSKIKFLEDIWMPVFTSSIDDKNNNKKESSSISTFSFCQIDQEITLQNVNEVKMVCSKELNTQNPFKGVLKIKPFGDSVHVKVKTNEDKIGQEKLVNLYFVPKFEENTTQSLDYLTVDDNEKIILCPNKPIFTINSKREDIVFDQYYPSTNKFTFSLSGNLSNGYTYINNTLTPLIQTTQEINFPLTLTDNLILDSDEKDIKVSCILSSNNIYNTQNNVTIKCLGNKVIESSTASKELKNFIDVTLNWELKKNNNFKDIIIIWPTSFDSSKKNMYYYKIDAISIKQSYYGCDIENDKFIFFMDILNLGFEPKVFFDLPLLYPKNIKAYCQIFQENSLKCEIDLRHKILKKGSNITLLSNGTEIELVNDEGNKNNFYVMDYQFIQNDRDNHVILQEDCGQFILMGTLNDMGLSKKTSFYIVIGSVVFVSLVVVCIILYIVCKIKNIVKRGEKLPVKDDSSNASSNNTVEGKYKNGKSSQKN